MSQQSIIYGAYLLTCALMMLFELRCLMQSAGVDYYNRITQWVVRLTSPLVSLPLIGNLRLGGISIAPLVVAFVIGLGFVIGLYSLLLGFPLLYMPLLAAVFLIKSTGYLIIGLFLVQALTSWLPSTRNLSWYLSTVTRPIVAPVQKIIPPIGMIDISLMVILFGLYFLNSLCYGIFSHIPLPGLISSQYNVAIPHLGMVWGLF